MNEASHPHDGRGTTPEGIVSPSDCLRSLLPAFAATVVATVGGDGPSPFIAERRLVSTAGLKRRLEFSAGRSCAHRALVAVTRCDEEIGMGPRGEPLWPPGVVGSISHARGLAGAAVARKSDALALGIDIEELEPPLTPEAERLVLAGRVAAVRDGRHSRIERYRSKVVFSAKESTFKCLYPHFGHFLEFGDVDVSIDLGEGRFTADARRPGTTIELCTLQGRFTIGEGHIFTGICIPAPVTTR